MAKSQNQFQNKSVVKGQKKDAKLKMDRQMENQEDMVAALNEPDTDADYDDINPDTVETEDVNDDETQSLDVEELYNPYEIVDQFDFNANSNTALISQKKNGLFLKRTSDGMKVFLTANLRKRICRVEQNYNRLNKNLDLLKSTEFAQKKKLHYEMSQIFHRFSKPNFVAQMAELLQEYLDGLYRFELDPFNVDRITGIFTSKMLADETENESDNIRKWLKNLSLQLEDGRILSFNLITPEGSIGKRGDYVTFRRALGKFDAKKVFYDLVQMYKGKQLKRFTDSSAFEDFCLALELTESNMNALEKSPDFKLLFKTLREKGEDEL